MALWSGLKWGNWRAFTREIAIVVIGVGVALAAGDVADAWNWKRKLAIGEVALGRETASNFLYAVEQVAVGPCIQAQLETARRRVLASGDTLDPAPVVSEPSHDYIYRMPSRPFLDTAWQALNSEGTTGYMDGARRANYAMLYQQVRDMASRRDALDLLNSRSLLLAEPIPLDPATRAALAGDLMETAGQSRLQSLVAGQIMGVMRDLGHAPPAAEVDARLAELSGTMLFCKERGLPMNDWRQVLAEIKPNALP